MGHQEPNIHVLDNGIRLVYLKDEVSVAHLGVTILAGSRFEKKGEEGLAHFLEHCIFKGTSKRRAYHVLSRIDSVGGELNAFTSKEEMCIYASFSQEHFMRSAELLADITFNPVFPEKEISKEKTVVLDEINSYLDSPSDKIFDDFENYMFPDNSLGNNILGTPETVMSFSSLDLKRFVSTFFYPENMVLSFVGNISEKKVLKKLNQYFGVIQRQGKQELPKPVKEYKPFEITSFESNYQEHILIGGLAPGFDDQERRIMTLLTNMLGGPALNSRLGLALREKYGYAYNVEASYTPYQELGYWSVYAGTDSAHTKKALKVIYKELHRFCKEKLTTTQLNRAKTQLKGHLALAMDNNSGKMLSFGKSLLIFNQIDTLEEIHAAIDEITSEDIQQMACKYFDKEKISTLLFRIK